MPDEGVVVPKQWMNERAEIEHFLVSATVGRLGTCREDLPYITPVNYVYADGCIYFHCNLEGRKLDNIAANPRVCFEIDEVVSIYRGKKGCDFGCRYRSVLASGTARVIHDPEAKKRLLNLLVEKYAGGHPYEPVPLSKVGSCAVVEIQIEEMTGKRNVDAGGLGTPGG